MRNFGKCQVETSSHKKKFNTTGTRLIHSIPIGAWHTWSEPGYCGTNGACWCRWVEAREDQRSSASSAALDRLTFCSVRDHKAPLGKARSAQSHSTSRSGSSFILVTMIKHTNKKATWRRKGSFQFTVQIRVHVNREVNESITLNSQCQIIYL